LTSLKQKSNEGETSMKSAVCLLAIAAAWFAAGSAKSQLNQQR
jgi:hypothetical protein